ncbi:hypothetical protein AWC19_25650 [Mycobacterium palustre]|uniref:Oxidoreductase n=1 Tax=Mycobacterium palustre TaxID=153971 RepID=A0A1X1ZXX6_9MYCO|nr:hypothetical protein AWC19_25650 [Mycobacterium palustre]
MAALSFAKEGAAVVGCDIDVDQSKETTELVIAAGGDMISVEPIDLAEPIEAERWVGAAIERWGKVDVLYNNAAAVGVAPFDEATMHHWDFTIRNELTLGYVAARAVWPYFVSQKRGVIVSVSSVAAHRELAIFPDVAHGVANAGVQAMARMFAAAGAPHGIRSISISPGVVNNPNAPGPFSDPNSPEMAALWGPAALGRPAEMQEIVNTAMFLASDDASYITGTDVAVDGGMSGIIWPGPRGRTN